MICAVCSDTRKIKFEGHIEDCPVCEEYHYFIKKERDRSEESK